MLKEHISGVGHIALELSDLNAGMHFFNELLGFKIKFKVQFKEHQIVMLKAGKIEIEMWERQNQAPVADATPSSVHHIAIVVKQLDSVVADLKTAGYTALSDIYAPTKGIREVIFSGPDDIRVQFVEQNIPLLIWRALSGDFKNTASD